jgi:hypothetical protein
MNITNIMHQLAMDMAAYGDVAKAKGLIQDAMGFYSKAFFLEYEAALKFPKETDALTKFIWLRSAASLAFKAHLYKESELLIELCQSEAPPVWIEKELQDISNLIAKAKNTSIEANKKPLQLSGLFKEVNSQKNEIIIEDKIKNQSFSVIVPRLVLVDIIRQYLAQQIHIIAHQTPHGVFVLDKIQAAA